MQTEKQKRLVLTKPKVKAEDVESKYGDLISEVFRGTSGATAANYSVFHNVTNPMEIVRILVSYTNPSTSGTLQLEKLTGTQAPGAGSTILLSTISLSGTANTVITRNQREMTNARTFKEGDRIAFIDGGTLTNLENLVVTIYYKPLGRGDYR